MIFAARQIKPNVQSSSMSERLQQLLRELTPTELVTLEDHLELLLRQRPTQTSDPLPHWQFDWKGSLQHANEADGVELQRSILEDWVTRSQGDS